MHFTERLLPKGENGGFATQNLSKGHVGGVSRCSRKNLASVSPRSENPINQLFPRIRKTKNGNVAKLGQVTCTSRTLAVRRKPSNKPLVFLHCSEL